MYQKPTTNSNKSSVSASGLRRQSTRRGPKVVSSRATKENWFKIIYLASISIFVSTFIVICILMHLVIIPYLHETSFIDALCRLNETRMGEEVKCENKCSKDRSRFRCLQIVVHYWRNGRIYSAFLYEHVATLRHFSKNRVSEFIILLNAQGDYQEM